MSRSSRAAPATSETDRIWNEIHALDWSNTSLGPIEAWPAALHTTLRTVLASRQPMCFFWGPDLLNFHNETYRPLLGAKAEGALGAPFRTLWADAWNGVKPFVDEALAGRGTWAEDLPLVVTRNGYPEETFWTFSYSPLHDDEGRVAGLLNIVTETTGNVLARRRLAASERRNRQILDSAIDYAIVATDPAGLVTRWNEGARRVLGWTEDEMLGQPADRFFTPEDVASGRVGHEMRSALETGRGNDERWHLRKTGERFWAVGEMTVLRDEAGAAVGFVKVLRDQTERRRAAEAERAAAARAAFLLDLEHLLRPLSNATDILNAAAEALGRRLTVDQVAYSDIDEAVQYGIIEHEWNGGSIPSNAGKHMVDDFGPGFAADLRAGRTIVVDDVRSDSRTSTPEALAVFDRVSIQAFLNLPIVKDGRLVALFVVHARMPRKWTDAEVSLAGEVAERVWASAVRARTEAQLRDALGFNELVLNSSRDCIVVLDLDGRTQFVSPGGIESMEITDVEAILGLSWLRVWKDEDAEAARRAVTEAAAGGIGRFQGFCPTHKGTPKWWDVVISPLPGPDGAPERLVSVGRDVTRQKLAEDQRRDLLREMSHRIKNSLAMVQAIVAQTFRQAKTVEEGREAITGRLATLARAQDILTASTATTAMIRDVVDGALAPHVEREGKFLIKGPDVELTSQQGLGLSLALHELSTNAAKYGALSNADGRVTIEWSLAPDGKLGFEWRESGGPAVTEPERAGFGSRLLKRMVASYFDGDAELAFERSGVAFRMSGQVGSPTDPMPRQT